MVPQHQQVHRRQRSKQMIFLLNANIAGQQHGPKGAIDMPEADGVPLAQINDQVEVTITSTGDYLVNGERLTASDSNSLRTALLRLGQDKVNYPLQIYADANVAYQAVVRVYDVAGQLGFVKLSLTTRESPNEAQ